MVLKTPMSTERGDELVVLLTDSVLIAQLGRTLTGSQAGQFTKSKKTMRE